MALQSNGLEAVNGTEDALRQLNAQLERRVAETTRGLRESEERFSKAFRASPVNMSIARLSDGKFVEANEAFLQAGGWLREEVIGHTSAELDIWPSSEARAAFLNELRRKGFARNQELVLQSRNRTCHTVLLSAELIEIDGEPHILAVSLNIDARKRAEEEMRRALEQEKELSRLKTNFVTLVSHEFRTPLGIIMSAADILKKYFDRLTADRRVEHLQDIHDASLRMADLMDEVLLLARVEAGKIPCTRAPLDLPAFCARTVDEACVAAGQKCPMEVTLNGNFSGATGDETLLRHIFSNLLSNALKYSRAGDRIGFSAWRKGKDVLFTIRDHGIGVPAANLGQLFQTFQRGSNVGERPGTGLGLVIVKRCVALHGGDIKLESRENEGTTVTVRLPLFDIIGKRDHAASKQAAATSTRKRTSLVTPRGRVRKPSKANRMGLEGRQL